MNNNNFSQITDQQTMTSMDIAQITGRAHKNVLVAIRNMEPAWEKITGLKFKPCERIHEFGNGAKKKVPYYELTKTECLFVATKFNDEARAKLVLRWEQLEKERLSGGQNGGQKESPKPQPPTANGQSSIFNVQSSMSDTLPVDPRNMTRLQILQLALQAEQEKEVLRLEKKELEDEKASMADDIRSLEADKYGLMLENGQKDQQIQQLEQRTAYMNTIMADATSVTASQIAQDYGMGAPSFNKLLNGLRIQRKVGEQWLLYSEHQNKGYVSTRMIPIHHAGAGDTFKPLTCWTQLGRKFLYDKLKKDLGLIPLVERTAATAAQ